MNHDQNFKNLILDYPRQALELFAAQESALFDSSVRITPVRQEQLKHKLKDRHRELDVPLMLEWPDGGREMVLFALEEETQASRFSIHRLAHYCLDLGEMFNTTKVVPVVIFLKKYQGATRLIHSSHAYDYLNFTFLYCELAAIPWQRYRLSNNIVARLNLPNMGHDKKERIDVYAYATHGLMSLESDINKRSKYIDFVDNYACLSNNEFNEYCNKYPKEAKVMSNFAERHFAQGVEQGMQQGMQQGEAAMLLKLLEFKFGPASSDTRLRVESADVTTLEMWSTKLFAVNGVEDLWH